MSDINGYSYVIKNVNKGIIKDKLLRYKSITKKDLTKMVDLSFPTVSRIIDEMEQSGEVLELGLDKSTGGRRAQAYKLNPDYAYTLSIYFQENNIWCLLSNVFGEIINKKQKKVEKEGYIHTIDYIIENCLLKYQNIKAVSIGVPGGVADGVIRYIDEYDELVDFHLKAHIEDKFNIPAYVENDMKAVVLGNYTKNYVNTDETVACIYLGHNGPGCGIVSNGKVINGFAGFAGEVGYLPVYDKNNLQKIALNNFKDTDVSDYFARLISSIGVILNPKYIVLYKNQYIPKLVNIITKKCSEYIPKIALPKIVISDDYYDDYEYGLIKLSKELIDPCYKIIRNGVIR